MSVQRDDQWWEAKAYEAMGLFSPGAPIDENELFAGRRQQIEMIMEAVALRGHHAIIFGERGVGKTSLARTFHYRLKTKTAEVPAVIVNCDPSDNFSTLWRKVLRDLSQGGKDLAAAYPGDIGPDEVRRVLAGFDLSDVPIIILDEFDKLKDQQARVLVANTIKALSDYSVNATLVIVGVASSVSELLEEHESISRALIRIPMPRMKAAELKEIIDKRLAKLGMKISQQALAQIIAISAGLPHYTHLLGMYATRRALNARTLSITETHIDQAENDCLDRVDQTIKEQYHRATHSPRAGNIYRQVLLACALAEPDELGYFPAKAIERPLSEIMGSKYDIPKFGQHLKILCQQDRGRMLEQTGTSRRFRYRFAEPLVQPYVLLRGLADGLIDKAKLSALMPNYLQPRLSSEF